MSSTESKNSKPKLKKSGNWNIGNNNYNTYSDFKHNYAGMVCGRLQYEMEKLREFALMTSETTEKKRTLLEETLKDLAEDVTEAVTSPKWKAKEEKSKSREYLLEVSAGLKNFNKSVNEYPDDQQLAVDKIMEAANNCIDTKPPSRLSGSFVTIKLKNGDSVPESGRKGKKTIQGDCTVVSLIKEIGEILKDNAFVTKVSDCYTSETLIEEHGNNDLYDDEN